MKMFVLADDLTGALEVGAKFSCAGISSLVTTELGLSPPSLHEDTCVLVVDTASRHLSPSDAGRRVRILSTLARLRGIQYLYKKTDSTLRGNIGRELEALSVALGNLPVVYVPAYPEMGRTVERGRLLVHGCPVSDTEFADDSLNPVRESHIPTLLASQTSLPVYSPPQLDSINDIPAGIHVFDGKTDDDVLECSRVFLQRPDLRLAAGPAAFAAGIASLSDWPRRDLAQLPTVERCLLVNGSRSHVALRQMEHALACGFRQIASSHITEEERGFPRLLLMPESAWAETSLRMARQMGASVCEVLPHVTPDALLIVGGDTARAVVQALGTHSLHPLGEIVAGVPFSLLWRPRAPDLHIITKAGGFGPIDIIETISRKLRRKD